MVDHEQCRPEDSTSSSSYYSKDVQEALEFWSMMRDDEDDLIDGDDLIEDDRSGPTLSLVCAHLSFSFFWGEGKVMELDVGQGTATVAGSESTTTTSPVSAPGVGTFLEVLVRSVDGWLNNSLEGGRHFDRAGKTKRTPGG